VEAAVEVIRAAATPEAVEIPEATPVVMEIQEEAARVVEPVVVLVRQMVLRFLARWQSFSLVLLALAHGRLETRRKPEHLRKSQSLWGSDWVACAA
jgi:hypothetical protein